MVIGDGTADSTGDGGPRTSAQVYKPFDVYAHPVTDELYVTERLVRRIRKRSTDDVMSTVAGAGAGSGAPVCTIDLEITKSFSVVPQIRNMTVNQSIISGYLIGHNNKVPFLLVFVYSTECYILTC
mmetsp:Transcript_37975/g.38661  ORF Transcript_37975/g.38661 Transcript_37975/m.38661 type:complete len:126 (+) Transcript_37975:598-975(+)